MAGALALPDEHSNRAERFLALALSEGEIWVPPLFWYEISNLCVAAMGRKRLTEASRIQFAELYSSLPLCTDGIPTSAIISDIQQLATAYKLSAYDAAYLELAQRLGSGLATLDEDLARAARQSGLQLFD